MGFVAAWQCVGLVIKLLVGDTWISRSDTFTYTPRLYDMLQ